MFPCSDTPHRRTVTIVTPPIETPLDPKPGQPLTRLPVWDRVWEFVNGNGINMYKRATKANMERLYNYWEKNCTGNEITIKGSAVQPGGDLGKRPEPPNCSIGASARVLMNMATGWDRAGAKSSNCGWMLLGMVRTGWGVVVKRSASSRPPPSGSCLIGHGMSEEIEVSDDGGCPNMGLETCFLDYHKSKREKGKKAAIIM
ncbi:hypothetical protein BJY52DRAFT_1355495 [Lactarius psammicola]|nr:hypothetical protein BJY52DRAFT_1355495 [Lactarius psammicola]